MKKIISKIPCLILLPVILMSGCNKIKDIAIPTAGPNSILSQTYSLSDSSKHLMEGIYQVLTGSGHIEGTVVVKWYRDKMSVFCEDGTYLILGVGYLDSVVMFEGYWRYPYGDATGLVSGHIGKDEGGMQIVTQSPNFPTIILRGGYGSSGNVIDNSLLIKYLRPFSDIVKKNRFDAVAHRSGGRTSDRLPVSENSIPMIRYTGYFGSNGIETDVRLTKDDIPVLYHDPDINIRETQKGPLSGPIGDYTFAQLEAFVRLIHGEKIPKLDDALTFVVDSTDLRFVWLDMKENYLSMAVVIPVQQAALERAKAKGRDLMICIGLPTQAAIDDFISQPDYQTITSLCELSIDDVHTVNAQVWAPRWTMGPQTDLVDQMHSEGRKAYCWTIDEPDFIRQYMQEGHFDGLLTNYPSVVSYYHYMR